MVKPGTGRRVGLGRLAPLPPSKSFNPAALGLAVAEGVDPLAGLHGHGVDRQQAWRDLSRAFFKAFRAAAAAPQAGADGFDFAAIFFDFATALAMAYKSKEDGRLRALPL